MSVRYETVRPLTERQRRAYDAAEWDWGGFFDRLQREQSPAATRKDADEATAMFARVAARRAGAEYRRVEDAAAHPRGEEGQVRGGE